MNIRHELQQSVMGQAGSTVTATDVIDRKMVFDRTSKVGIDRISKVSQWCHVSGT